MLVDLFNFLGLTAQQAFLIFLGAFGPALLPFFLLGHDDVWRKKAWEWGALIFFTVALALYLIIKGMYFWEKFMRWYQFGIPW